MGDIPIRANPNVHPWSDANIGCDSRQQRVPSATILSGTSYALVSGVQPSQRRADEPLSCDILRFVWSVRQPEPRFKIVADACCLRSLRTQQSVEVLIS